MERAQLSSAWLSCRGQNGEEIPQDVQALDIALKQSVSYRDEVKAFARAIFWHDPNKVKPLGNGAEAWPLRSDHLQTLHACCCFDS